MSYFFFNDTATTEIYTLSLHDALPISAGAAPGMFHNVYVQPWAYREFIRTGAFPERTMFVLSFYEASRKSAPARAGFYEGDRMPGIEVHLKQKGIDKTGWGFFGFGDGAAPAMMIPGAAPCYSCHATEAAHDQVDRKSTRLNSSHGYISYAVFCLKKKKKKKDKKC